MHLESLSLDLAAMVSLARPQRYDLRLLHVNSCEQRIAQLVFPEDQMLLPPFLCLRNVSIRWERSLAFWLHAQALLAHCPVERFHIIRSSTLGEMVRRLPRDMEPPRWGTPPSPALPRTILSPELMADITTLSLNDASVRLTNDAGHLHSATLRLFYVLKRLGLMFFARETASLEPHHEDDLFSMSDSFIQQFGALHNTTLRQFWVIGMRCSETAIRDLCKRCEKLEHVRAEDVDEYPVRVR